MEYAGRKKKKNQKLVMVMRGLAASVSSRYHRVQKCIFLIFKIMIPFYKKKKKLLRND